jgi:putative membrane protein
MVEWMAEYQPWIKAFHVISVIAWMAGMLYLPRLFVYHCGVAPGSEASEMLKVMERRLLRAIINPAMLGTFAFGGALLAIPSAVDWWSGWMEAKLALVLAMAVLHGLFARWRIDFATGRHTRPAGFYRVANEAPTVLMIAIVILVMVRPG